MARRQTIPRILSVIGIGLLLGWSITTGLPPKSAQAQAATQLITSRGWAGQSADSGQRQMQTAIKVQAAYAAGDIRLAFSNPADNGITVSAAVWRDGQPYQVTAGGQSSLELKAKHDYVVSDTVSGLSVSEGDQLELRTYVRSADGNVPAMQHVSSNSGDGLEQGAALADKTMSGKIPGAPAGTSAQRAYTPMAVIGSVSDGPKPALLIAGDSLSVGIGDTYDQSGYLAIAAQKQGLPYIRVGQAGSTIKGFLKRLKTDSDLRFSMSLVNHMVAAYGINSFQRGQDDQVAESEFAKVGELAAVATGLKPGLKIAVATVMPYANAQNTAPRMTVPREYERVRYNNLVRQKAKTIPGVSYVWDAAGTGKGYAGVEAGKDAGTFRRDYMSSSSSGGYGDGLHPDRPLLLHAAAALDTQAYMGLPRKWNPGPPRSAAQAKTSSQSQTTEQRFAAWLQSLNTRRL